MASKGSGFGRQNSNDEEKQLFPIMLTINAGSTIPSPLFPSAVTKQNSPHRTQTEADWLSSKSFTQETAEKVVQFQKELHKIQANNSGENAEATSEPTNEYSHRDSRETRDITRQDRSSEDKKKKKKHKRRYSSDSDDSRSHRKKKKSKHRRDYKRRDDSSDKESEKKQIPGLLDNKKFIFFEDVADIAPDHPFKLDKLADKYSWTYGSLYSGNVANYRTACENCIGNQQVVMANQKKAKGLKSRYFDKDSRKLVRQVPQQVVPVDKSDKNLIDKAELFVPLDDFKTTEELKTANDPDVNVRDKVLDKSTALYVLGKGDLKPIEQIDDVDIELDRTLQKIGHYNKMLREEPNNVKLWLEFVKFQDSLTGNDGTGGELSGKSERKLSRKGLLEKKISIIDKALENNAGNLELMLAKIELNSEILDSTSVCKELEQLLFVHVANTILWKYYLMFNQSRLASFTVSKVTVLYHKALKSLLAIHTGKVHTHTVPKQLEKEILEIFLQYCYFLRQVGHKERAISTIQAILEFNLFTPPTLADATMETKLTAFEQFWDACSCKLGMDGALGWKNYHGNYTDVAHKAEVPLDDKEEAIIEKKLPKYQTWLEIENLRDRHHLLPWQPDTSQGQTEDDCEDPDRLVVFDDVKPVIFQVRKKFHLNLVLAVLELLGFRSDKLELSIFHMFTNKLQDDLDRSNSIGKENASNSLEKDFAVNLIQQVLPYFTHQDRTLLTLHMIEIQLKEFKAKKSLSKSDKKEMRKVLKNLLKEEYNRNNLDVWCSYIKLERTIGKPGEAKGIADTALSMYSGKTIDSANNDVVSLISLYGLYCDILLNVSDDAPKMLSPKTTPVPVEIKTTVPSVLFCMLEGKTFTPQVSKLSGPALLKISSTFPKLIDKIESMQFSDSVTRKFLNLVKCYALFLYCTKGMEAVLNLYDEVLEKVVTQIENGNATMEGGGPATNNIERNLHVQKLQHIVHHMSVSACPLALLRSQLDIALNRFPEDSIFLALFIDIERKSRISGRFNKYFDRQCRLVDSPKLVSMAVEQQCKFLSELRMEGDDSGVSCSGIIHRARHWLEHSVGLPGNQHSPQLWRLYIHLESLIEGVERSKGVYYRAIQQCPWAKSLYMDGLQQFGDSQLQEIVDLMTEKELRIRLPVEELDILMTPVE